MDFLNLFIYGFLKFIYLWISLIYLFMDFLNLFYMGFSYKRSISLKIWSEVKEKSNVLYAIL